jgi:hypothetical protein
MYHGKISQRKSGVILKKLNKVWMTKFLSIIREEAYD